MKKQERLKNKKRKNEVLLKLYEEKDSQKRSHGSDEVNIHKFNLIT